MKIISPFKYGFFMVLVLASISCKKLVEVDVPITSITAKAVYSDDVTAVAAITGMYAQISNQLATQPNTIVGISTFTGLSGDELQVLSGLTNTTPSNELLFYRNELSLNNNLTPWVPLYAIANASTYAIEKLSAQVTKDVESSSNLTSGVKKQLLGEAKFIRAFCYFYLVNLYGDVPLLLTANSFETSKMGREPKSKVYEQMILDLNDAKGLLSKQFLNSTLTSSVVERVRPTYWAATALLARVYLYTGNNAANAETNASEVIENTGTFGLTTLDQAFLKNTKENIWQLQPVVTGWNTAWGRAYVLTKSPSILTSDNPYKPFFLSDNLINSFDTGDPRKTNWIGSIVQGGVTYYFPNKFKKGGLIESGITSTASMTEYMTVLRISEQYLIRAEARLMQGNVSGAVSDLNIIRLRARNGNGSVLPDISSSLSKDALLMAIAKERRCELFTEWGDRWFDLKRTGKIDEVMKVVTPQKSQLSWNSYQSLYPIPIGDVQKNPAIMQNPGYNQ